MELGAETVLMPKADRTRSAAEGAAAYEQSFTVEQRRRSGTVYTPPHLAEFVLDLVGYLPDGDLGLESCRVLDPACGCGVFLEAAVRRIVEHLKRLGVNLLSPEGTERLFTVVEATLFGIDKDPRAAELTVHVVQESVRAALKGASLPPQFFIRNIRVADFLDAPPVEGLFAEPIDEMFDVIVGNPPYVTTTRLSTPEKMRLRRRFSSAHGRIDLYALFFERSLELLRSSGRLAFITPDKFLTSESARPLRRHLLERAAVKTVARFRSHRVFRDAAIVPCVTVLERSPRSGDLEHLDCATSEGQRRVFVAHRYPVAAPTKDGTPWHFLDPELDALIQHLRGGHPVLGQLATRISAGIATGRDRVFVVPTATAEDLEPELLHRAVRGQDIRPHSIADSGLRVIVPYSSSGGEPPQLVKIEDYPRIHRYLTHHRSELSNRHCVQKWGKAWYDLHDPWTFDVANTAKVVLPDVANSNRFAFDAGGRLPLHSVYYIVLDEIDGEAVTAILNSSTVELLVRLFAPVVKDGFSRYRKQFLMTVPIPILESGDRNDLVHLARSGDHDGVDEVVARAYSLSTHQRRTIRDQVARLRAVGAPLSRSSGSRL